MSVGLCQASAVFVKGIESWGDFCIQQGTHHVIRKKSEIFPPELLWEITFEITYNDLGAKSLCPLFERHIVTRAVPLVPMQVYLNDGRELVQDPCHWKVHKIIIVKT